MVHFFESHNASRASESLVGAHIVDAGGHHGSVVSMQQPEGEQEAQAWIRLEDGTQMRIPLSLLAPQDDGAYHLPFIFEPADGQRPMQMTFPVMEEELQVGKRTVDTGRGVRIHKTVSEQDKVLDQPLMREQLVVEHVPVGRVVEESNPPKTRYEGDTLVVPVLEEVLVVQKQLLLKEEVHITRQRHHETKPHTERLRSEQVTVERFDEG